MRRRSSLIGRVLVQCDDISAQALAEVRGDLDAAFGEELRKIDEVSRSVHDARALRTNLDRDIRAIQVEAESMLEQLQVPVVDA